MKHRLIILLLLLGGVPSCSLDEKMVSSSRPEEYYKTEVQCIAALNGCYNPLRSIYCSYTISRFAKFRQT